MVKNNTLTYYYNMETVEKLIIGAGACLLASAVGYCSYKFYKTRAKDNEDDWESASEEEDKVPLITLMDYALIEGVTLMTRYIEDVDQYKLSHGSNLGPLRELLEKLFVELEVKICIQNGWDPEEYGYEIDARQQAKDPEVTKRILSIERIIRDTLDSKVPQVDFTFDPKLTPELALTLYRWAIIAQTYDHYKAIRKCVKRGRNIEQEEYEKMLRDATDARKDER